MIVAVGKPSDVMNIQDVDPFALQAPQAVLVGTHNGVIRVIKLAFVGLESHETLPRATQIDPGLRDELAPRLRGHDQFLARIELAKRRPQALLTEAETIVRSRVEVPQAQVDSLTGGIPRRLVCDWSVQIAQDRGTEAQGPEGCPIQGEVRHVRGFSRDGNVGRVIAGRPCCPSCYCAPTMSCRWRPSPSIPNSTTS